MAGPASGKRIGASIAAIGAKVARDHTEATAPFLEAVKAKGRQAFLEGLERELTPFLSEMWGKVAADETVPPEIRAMAASIAGPEHQFTALLQFAAAALSVFTLAGAISQPLAMKLLQDRNQETPHGLLTLAELALAQVKNVPTGFDKYAEALKGGFTAERLDAYTRMTGNPPGLQELLLLFRRGQIDQERLLHGVHQSLVKDEWFDAVLALRHMPPGPGLAVEAVLKGHLGHDAGRALYDVSGVDPSWFDVAVASAGRPIGVGEGLELLRRGEIDVGHMQAIVRQSDVNDAFMADVLKLAVTRPPPRSVPALIHAGAITDAQAFRLLKDHGYSDELATAVLHAAHHEKTQTHHDVAEAQIVRGYRERFIDHGRAAAMLEGVGWTAEEAGFLLGLADAERDYQLTQKGISTVHSRYVHWHISRTEASSALDRLNVPPAARDDLIRVWDLEHEETRADLTEAQIVGLWTRSLITDDDAHARLLAKGYRETDAHLLMALAGTPAQRAPAGGKTLTLAQLLKAVRSGDMTPATAHDRIIALGYSEADTQLLLSENPPPQAGP